MILSDYKFFPRSGRIIGIDWGARRCGVAVSDDGRDFVFVRPQITVKNSEELLKKLSDIIIVEKFVGVVIGLPLHADGSDSSTTVKVREFANALSSLIDAPIIFVEENLTSAAAQEEIGRKKLHQIKQELDSVSAKIILENAIAMLKRI